MSKKSVIYFPGKRGTKKKRITINSKNSSLGLIDFSFIKVGGREKIAIFLKKREAVIVLLSGEIKVNGKYLLGPRKNVFSGKSHSVYICGVQTLEIVGLRAQSECIVVLSPTVGTNEIVDVITPRKVNVKEVGKDTYQRSVHTIFEAQKNRVDSNLIIGETYNAPGKWSSFPPHKHAKQRPPHETRFEEIYFFKIEPADSFGFLRVYDKRHDASFAVQNNDSVIVTEGYHPVCAAPGTRLYYFWTLFGKKGPLMNDFDRTFS